MASVCDAKDGVKDGLIFNTKECDFDPGELVCKERKTDACLSAKQVETLRKVFAGRRIRAAKRCIPTGHMTLVLRLQAGVR